MNTNVTIILNGSKWDSFYRMKTDDINIAFTEVKERISDFNTFKFMQGTTYPLFIEAKDVATLANMVETKIYNTFEFELFSTFFNVDKLTNCVFLGYRYYASQCIFLLYNLDDNTLDEVIASQHGEMAISGGAEFGKYTITHSRREGAAWAQGDSALELTKAAAELNLFDLGTVNTEWATNNFSTKTNLTWEFISDFKPTEKGDGTMQEPTELEWVALICEGGQYYRLFFRIMRVHRAATFRPMPVYPAPIIMRKGRGNNLTYYVYCLPF